MNTVTWEHPEEYFDDNGYPTPEALDYIKNWSVIHGQLDVKFGSKFGKNEYGELIEYIKNIWCYDTLEYEDGLLELHTMGWSGNESIIEELRNTDLWHFKFRAQQAGGHYFFKIDSEAEQDWYIVKSKDKS